MNSNEDDSANPSDSGEDLKSKSGDNDLHCPGDSGDGSDVDDVNAGALTERKRRRRTRRHFKIGNQSDSRCSGSKHDESKVGDDKIN